MEQFFYVFTVFIEFSIPKAHAFDALTSLLMTNSQVHKLSNFNILANSVLKGQGVRVEEF